MAENILQSAGQQSQATKRTKNLSNSKRQNIIEFLLQHSTIGKPKRGMFSSTADKFNVSRQSINKLWRQATLQFNSGGPINVKGKKKGKCERKRIHVDLSGLMAIPLSRRTNLRSIAVALRCSKSTVHMLLKKGLIRAYSSTVKPFFTPANMKKRLEYCISQIESYSPNMFSPNYQTIHIDEKWFYLTKQSNRYYLDSAEIDPYRTYKNKRFITKVMFMGAVARPRYGLDGNTTFDGKIKIFPFVVEEPAKRKSKNRPVGVMETKAELSITKSVIKTCLMEKLLPAIKTKWSANASKTIVIQQDNARSHLDPNDPEWVEACTEGGWNIKLQCQPANSLDLNVLGLDFFRAIQSLQHQNSSKTVIELVEDVLRAYNDLEIKSLNFVWLSLQQCMLEIMKVNGSNSYKLAHMNKNGLLLQGLLPDSLEVPQLLLDETVASLQGDSTTAVMDTEIQFMDEDADDLHP